MLQAWRREIRQAEAAYRAGELERAGQMLAQGNLREFLPGKRLAGQVADGMLTQAAQLAHAGESSAGWRKYNMAARLHASPEVDRTRTALVERSLGQIEQNLQAGELHEALARIQRLETRHARTVQTRQLARLAHLLQAASDLSRQGKFAEAEACLARAEALRPAWSGLAQQRRDCRLKAGQARALEAEMFQALAAESWAEVQRAAETLLELAPEQAAALQARRQAWAAVGIRVSRDLRPQPSRTCEAQQDTHREGPAARGRTVSERRPTPRLLMWIDAVGGYLVCLGNEIILGSPGGEGAIELPILADLSRRHAVIRRDGEGYLVEPLREVTLDGVPLAGPAALSDGSLIVLGSSVELRFRRPHPLSVSARLEVESRHRTEQAVDGVLLMADSLVLGPKPHSHVLCRRWQQELVLFHQGDKLFCRSRSPYEVDGQRREGRAEMDYNSRVVGEDFAVSLEAV